MKLNQTKIIPIILLSLLGGLLACGEEKRSQSVNELSIPVKILKVENQSFQPSLKVSGIVKAQQAALISSRIMGRLERINFKIGDQIKKGDVLISLKSEELDAKSAQIEAKIEAAESNFKTVSNNLNRMKSLYKKESISLQELEAAENQFQSAKSQLEAAKQMKAEVLAALEEANIQAPYAGVLVNRFIEIGDMAMPGKPLLAIEQPTNFEVRALIPESYITQISMDSTLEVTIKSMQRKLKGKLIELSSSAENTGGQFVAKIALSEAGFPIRSGMFAEVELPLQSDLRDEGLFIPQSALVEKGGLQGVYTLSQSNTAILRWLRLGEKKDNQIKVLSGLTEGERIIQEHDGKIFNGAVVEVQ